MTKDQADTIADKIASLPKLYEAPPNLTQGIEYTGLSIPFYPWVQTSSYRTAEIPAYGKAENLYYAAPGFYQYYYGRTITDWESTPYSSSAWNKSGPRYITIDDLRMMAYVGIEYARAKLEGWRYRFGDCLEEGAYYQKGCIVRLQDGMRFVHRRGVGNLTSPPGSGGSHSNGYYAYKFWTPMKRMPGFGIPQFGAFDYPDDFEVPSEPYTGIIRLGSLEGNDDIVRFNIQRTECSWAEGSDVYLPRVESGGMDVVISTESYISDENIANLPVVFQMRSFPIYYSWYTAKSRTLGEKPYRSNFHTSSDEVEITLATVYCRSGVVPLKRGVTYNVFARFSDAVLKKYQFVENHIVTYSRTPTRTTAPYCWEGDTWNSQQTS